MNLESTTPKSYFLSPPEYLKKFKETLNCITSFFDAPEKEPLAFPDPLYTIIQLGLINEPHSKITVEGTTIFIQKSDFFQPFSRWISGQSRNELKNIKYSILKATEWYPVKDYPHLVVIYKQAIIGLLILRETYGGSHDFIEEGLDTYISVISSTFELDNLPSEYLLYAKKLKSKGIIVYSQVFETQKTSTIISEFSKQLKEKMDSLWDYHTLNSINNLFQKIKESKEDSSKDEGIKAIQALIENSPKKFQKVLDELHPLLKNNDQ